MKQLVVLIGAIILFTSCRKTSGNNSVNAITIADNEFTYTKNNEVDCSVTTHFSNFPNNNTSIYIQTIATAGFPITMQIYASPDLSLDKSSAIDTISRTSSYTIGGVLYNVDSGIVNMTLVYQSAVSGNFKMWLSNTSGNKTITGTFNCTNAQWFQLD